jgi:hypothetical protein
VVQSYSYSPFGETTPANGNVANPFQFTGRENKVNGLGLLLLRERIPCAPLEATHIGMKKHYLIFSRPGEGHSVVHLVRAHTPLEAIQQLMREDDDTLVFASDGSIVMPYGRKRIYYPHPLAYIEANEKVWGEWQIRELPEHVWGADYEEIFCGENSDDIEWYLDYCRPVLRREFPRSRAPGFVWYLRHGVLVTFYRRSRPFEIQELGRYLIPKIVRRGMREGSHVSAWTGGYSDLLDQLLLLRYDWDRASRSPQTGSGNDRVHLSEQRE